VNQSTAREESDKAVSVRSTGAITVDVILLLVLLGLLPQTMEFGDSARRFPLATIVVLLGLITLDLVMELVPAARRRLGFLEADYIAATATTAHRAEELADAADHADSDAPVATPRHREFSQWSAIGWLTAVAVGMYYLGYLVTTPIFLGAFFLWSRVPAKVAIGITAALSLFNYFVFYQYLGLR
jgi:hypothetical protein